MAETPRRWSFARGLFIAGAAALWLSPANAGSLIVTCEPPQGARLDYGGQGLYGEGPAELSRSEDGLSRTYPVFIFDEAAPGVATSVWGDTVPEGMTRERVEQLSPTETKTLPIIFSNGSQIVLAEVQGNGVWLHSLYPKRGVGIFSRQTHWQGGHHAIGSIMISACTFATADS